eukprot:5039400-Karenia_brevis.AAC.2
MNSGLRSGGGTMGFFSGLTSAAGSWLRPCLCPFGPGQTSRIPHLKLCPAVGFTNASNTEAAWG